MGAREDAMPKTMGWVGGREKRATGVSPEAVAVVIGAVVLLALVL